MRADATLHCVFLGTLLLLAGVRANFRSRVRRAESARQAAPNSITTELRHLAAIIAGILVSVHSFVPKVFSWTDLFIWPSLRWLAALVSFGGVVWLWWATRAAAERRVQRGPLREWHSTGPYRLTRHPVQFGVLVEIAALTILSANWVIALIGAAWAAHLVLVRLPQDEAKRLSFLGDQYQRYSAVTPLLLPRLGHARSDTPTARRDKGSS